MTPVQTWTFELCRCGHSQLFHTMRLLRQTCVRRGCTCIQYIDVPRIAPAEPK